MSESPRKRQRTSPDTYQAVDVDQEDRTTNAVNPTTPKRRASYLSPTKASLSRSHPDILAKSPRRGPRTEPRGRLLRKELLGSRKSTNESITAPRTAPRLSQNTEDQQSKGFATGQAERDGFAQAIARSFENADSVRPKMVEANKPAARSPLRSRQPSSTTNYGEDQGHGVVPVMLPVPKLVRRQDAPTRQQSEMANEPDLPPTPIQLGIQTAPDRPRGLASSSSAGSKSGSGRHRRRVRERGGAAITSSPLKPKNTRPLSPTDFSDIEDIVKEVVEEAPESDNGNINVPRQDVLEQATAREEEPEEDVLPSEIREKQAQIAALQLELEELKKAIANDEDLVGQLQQVNDLSIDEAASELLKSFGAKATNEYQWSSELHPSFVKDPIAYLALFAPGNLQLEHETTVKGILKKPNIIHKMTCSAPKPWLSSALYLSLNVEVDTEDASVSRVTVAPPTNTREYGNFHHWIASRLRSPLHKLDVGGIFWGAGRYLEACTKRARVLQHLDRRYNLGESPGTFSETKRAVCTSTDVAALSKYLHRAQLVLLPSKNGQVSQHVSVQADSQTRRILLSYEIDITWTGETTVQVDVSFTAMNARSQRDLKELFAKLLPSQGVVGAFESVYDVMNNVTRADGIVDQNSQAASKN